RSVRRRGSLPTDGQGQQVTVEQVVGTTPQGLVLGDLVGGHHGILGLLRTLGHRAGRQNTDGDLAEVVRIGGCGHVGGEELTLRTTDRGAPPVAGRGRVGGSSGDVVRRLLHRLARLGGGRVVRHGRGRMVGEEGAGT